ncbi:MAG: hypothetical protein AAGF12_28665 [Myxococcota bacterium]
MRRLIELGLVVTLVACSPASSGSGTGPRTSPGTDGGTRPDGSSSRPDAQTGDASFNECVGDSQRAETKFQPVDVIWVVDRSGSMRGEADIVQSNINNFATAIGMSGIDYRVVMISSMEFV